MPARPEKPLKTQTLTNLALLILAPAPSFLYYAHCGANTINQDPHGLCTWSHLHPLILVNVLFFVNVCVIFWVLSLLQGSTWVHCHPVARLQSIPYEYNNVLAFVLLK